MVVVVEVRGQHGGLLRRLNFMDAAEDGLR